MNISTIEQYVEQKNRWNAIFKGRQLSLLNKADRQSLANSIDAELSPENLTCDGEIRGAQLRQKQAYLFRCAEELLSIDPSVTFDEMGV
jgi:uncharacterized phage-like protein YoqJ